MSPSPNTFHQHIAGNLHLLIGSYLQTHPLGVVLLAPLDVFLSDVNVFQPDLVVVSNERRSLLAEHGIEGPPDLVVEILSASTARYDRLAKRKVYARTGVRELWMVDPEAKLIQVYHLSENPDTPAATYDSQGVFTSRVLPGLQIEAAKVFARP